MAHSHTGHDHGHAHGPHNYGRAFAIGIFLNTAFVAIETFYGIQSHSLALLSDAGHNLSDVLALLLAWVAGTLATRKPSPRFTYGLRSSTILAALINACVLLVVMGGIGWEAIQRLTHPVLVDSGIVMAVAAVGVAINTATALLFMAGRHHDLNVRGAFLHMAADAAISLGVVLTGWGMLVTGWLWLDPLVSLILVAVIVVSTWSLLRESAGLALHAVPAGIDPTAIRAYLAVLPGVREVHDLHIWAMSTTANALTVHLVMPDGYPGDVFLAQISCELHERFHIEHPTLQVEIGDPQYPCALASDHVV